MYQRLINQVLFQVQGDTEINYIDKDTALMELAFQGWREKINKYRMVRNANYGKT